MMMPDGYDGVSLMMGEYQQQQWRPQISISLFMMHPAATSSHVMLNKNILLLPS